MFYHTIFFFVSDECGISGGGKITGGEEATPHSYPWMAALFFDVGDDTYFCGGTVVRNKQQSPTLMYAEPEVIVDRFLTNGS